jgi:cobalt-zinc-cadmium efflux system membrane fusion protein
MENRPHALRKRTQLSIVLVLALLVCAALGLRNAHLSGLPSEANAEQKVSPVNTPGSFRPTPEQLVSLKVTLVATVAFRTELTTEGKIAINSDKTTPVFSPYTGRVAKIIANLGDRVKQGTPLLAVEATEFVQAQNDLISAVSSLNTAHSQLNQAQINENRKHALYDARGGALQDWQQSQADLVTARNNVRSADIALALVRNRLRILGKTEKEISALENAQKINPLVYLVAPINGTVTDRQVGLGQYIQANAPNPVYSIGDLSTIWLIANVRELDAPLMRLGEPVEVHVMAFPGQVFKAKLAYVAPSVDTTTRRLAVRAEVENPDGELKPEMFATFSIITGDESEKPAVPMEAVVYEGDTARVWVAQKDGSISGRLILTGRMNSGMVEVLDGLTAGEKIVTSGTLFIDRAAKAD